MKANITSKKDLAKILSTVKGFKEPDPELEQYVTPSEIAAGLLWTAYMDGNIEGKKVCDLGCGTGLLSIGASILGASLVVGYELDGDALGIAEENYGLLEKSEVPTGTVRFVQKDVGEVEDSFDAVVMNPPFGVQRRGADLDFLQKAFQISDVTYSIHKWETRDFIQNFARQEGFDSILVSKIKFPLKKTLDWHEKDKHVFDAVLVKFKKVE